MTPISSLTTNNYPPIGWRLDGKLIHTPYAYTRFIDWISHFEATFPDKAARMRAYSKEHGQELNHVSRWAQVIPGWLNKYAERI